MFKTKLDDKLNQALLGRSLYINIISEYRIQNVDLIFLIDDSNSAFFHKTLEFIQHISLNSGKTVHLIIDDNCKNRKALLGMSCIFETKENMNLIIQFYNLYMFADNLYVLSPYYPKSRTAYNLTNQNQITVDDYIEIGLLKNFYK